MNRHILHVHIPALAIALARISRPEIRERPVAVAPPQSDRALLLSVSSEARREGVFKGMPLGAALKRCPDLRVIPPDPEGTQKASRVLAGMVARYTPLWEPLRPGHIYLDVTGTDRLWGRAKDTAGRLREDVKGGLGLCGSVGVAGNKMVSSIASRVMPSEGVLDVDPGREAPFIAPLGVEMVPGIGRLRRKALLEELNILRVRELAALDLGNLKVIFGRQACVIHQRALGIDPTPVYPPQTTPAVAEEIMLPEDENDDRRLLGALYGLVERCARRLRKGSRRPRRAGLLFRYADQMEVRRQVRLPCPSFWDFDLYDPLETLFLKACTRRVRVRYLRVSFWDFSAESGQLSLFRDTSPEGKGRCGVIQALDRIRARHGEGAIGYGRAA